MRMPRFRFTLRRGMIAVAVIGVAASLYERHVRFARLAAYHRDKAIVGRPFLIATYLQSGTAGIPSPYHERHDSLAEKYERAARYPWLPVAPDPPKPE